MRYSTNRYIRQTIPGSSDNLEPFRLGRTQRLLPGTPPPDPHRPLQRLPSRRPWSIRSGTRWGSTSLILSFELSYGKEETRTEAVVRRWAVRRFFLPPRASRGGQAMPIPDLEHLAAMATARVRPRIRRAPF